LTHNIDDIVHDKEEKQQYKNWRGVRDLEWLWQIQMIIN